MSHAAASHQVAIKNFCGAVMSIFIYSLWSGITVIHDVISITWLVITTVAPLTFPLAISLRAQRQGTYSPKWNAAIIKAISYTKCLAPERSKQLVWHFTPAELLQIDPECDNVTEEIMSTGGFIVILPKSQIIRKRQASSFSFWWLKNTKFNIHLFVIGNISLSALRFILN